VLRRPLLLWLLFSLAATASAQDARATLDRYRAAETPEDPFHLSRATDLGHLRFGAQLHLDYAHDPLVYEATSGDAGTELLPVVEHQLVGTVGLSLGLFDRLVVHAGLPVVLAMTGAPEDEVTPLDLRPADGAGLGDLVLGARVRLLGEEDDIGALAFQAAIAFPTAGESAYRGDPSVTGHPELVGELRPIDDLVVLANVGVLIRQETSDQQTNLLFGSELTYGLGVFAPVWRDTDPRTYLEVGGQLYGWSTLSQIGVREGTALEATAGARFFHAVGAVGGLAIGPGLTRGFGSPDVRIVLTLGWRMMPGDGTDSDGDGVADEDDACPADAEDRDDFRDEDGCPDVDDDEDGILDVDDACRLEPETINGVEDEDGCPDEVGPGPAAPPVDTDGDGLTDDVDACPGAPEDDDDFEDEDGCPDPDNDGDGVLDTADRCPLEAGVVANEGCPDADRDGDTVVDRIDNCPDEPGTVENHGCEAVQQVILVEGRLEILDNVYFRTSRATIQERSYPLLMNVAEVLQAHPELDRVVVEGHTDSRGRAAYNRRLSRERAEAVVDFLVERGGVDRGRLEAVGYGPDRPVVPDASTPEEHARNRRVEFTLPESDVVRTTDAADASAQDLETDR
jgi:outer membrane protein OmpA-like peptidoglycan-associated protein